MTPSNLTGERCPTCGGGGLVPQGFFMYPAGQSFVSAHTGPDVCRTCEGSGVVKLVAGVLIPVKTKLSEVRHG